MYFGMTSDSILLCHSLDARATSIEVVVKCFAPSDFKFIKIRDDGHGFQKEDLPLACERFATSKLGSYEELTAIKTFGFRGEALASISRVAKVSILSRTPKSEVGYQMDYELGQPKTALPIAKASNLGTIITITDLFYNDKKRRNTLPNIAEEFNKITELLSLYSLNNTNVSFRLSKEGSGVDSIRTNAGEELLTRVKNVMGVKVSNNLIPIKLASDVYKFEATGLFSDLNCNLKSYKMVIFVNNRLVECAPLKKALEAVYKSRLPKGSCPFVLLCLKINATLDVNIHPTKQEVRFDYEEQIIDAITSHIDTAFTATSNVGTAQLKTASRSAISIPSVSGISRALTSLSNRPDLMNRSDHSIRTITSMLKQKPPIPCSYWREVMLTSVRELRSEQAGSVDETLRTLFNESTYIGVVVAQSLSILIQSGTSLFSVHLEPLSRELLYQKFLADFGNFGVIELESKPPVQDLLQCHHEKQEFNIEAAIDIIKTHQAMIHDYFSVVISSDLRLVSLPIVVNGYIPNFKKLPQFLYDLAYEVDWTEEKRCFRSFGECLSKFYSISSFNEDVNFESIIRDNVFPLIQRKLNPSSSIKDHMYAVTNVPTLYKVFHRC